VLAVGYPLEVLLELLPQPEARASPANSVQSKNVILFIILIMIFNAPVLRFLDSI
jgi:hypothetical protein